MSEADPTLVRLDDQINWYDRKSSYNQRAYKWLEVVEKDWVLGLGRTCEVGGFSRTGYEARGGNTPKLGFVSMREANHPGREQWQNYRSTEQFIGAEKFQFLTKEGPYKRLEPTEESLLLVERVENAMASENAATLNIMALTSEVREGGKSAART